MEHYNIRFYFTVPLKSEPRRFRIPKLTAGPSIEMAEFNVRLMRFKSHFNLRLFSVKQP